MIATALRGSYCDYWASWECGPSAQAVCTHEHPQKARLFLTQTAKYPKVDRQSGYDPGLRVVHAIIRWPGNALTNAAKSE